MRRIGLFALLGALCIAVVVIIAEANLFGDRSSALVVVVEAALVAVLVFALTYLVRPANRIDT